MFVIRKLKKDVYGFVFSTLVILGGITASLAIFFPVILPSANAFNEHLTIYNTTAEEYGLSVALYWD